MKRDCVFFAPTQYFARGQRRRRARLCYHATARLLVMPSGLKISIWSGQVCNRSFRITVSRNIFQAPHAPGAPKIYDELQLSARNLKPSR